MLRWLKLTAQAVSVGAVVGLLALLVWKVVHQNRHTAASEIAHGKTGPAPSFSLPRLNGDGKLTLVSLRGKAIVLNFWNSYCVPCQKEAPALEAAWHRYRSQGLVVVGVDVYDFKGDGRRFARKYGVTYPLVHDGGGATIDSYGLTGYPETFFVDRRGRLVGEHLEGPIQDGGNRTAFTRAIERALAS